MVEARIVIIGAGPAGMKAALSLVEAGHRPVVIDEAQRSGGQVYRRPSPAAERSPRALYGFEAARAQRLHQGFDAIADFIDYYPETLIWNAEGRTLDLLYNGQNQRIAWSHLILATGAMDRIIPVSGWTLPGAYTLGAAQIALKAQAVGIGQSVVFFGTGPLLYLVAYQYAKAGITVKAVLDVSAFRQSVVALPQLLTGGRTFAKGLFFLAWLRARRIPVLRGITPVEIVAGTDQAVAGITIRTAGGKLRHFDCSGVGFGYGLRSETQIADLLELEFAFEHNHRQWLPVSDDNGRASTCGVYLAGDGAGILGADAAELTGRRAALVLRFDLGETELAAEIDTLSARLNAMRPFRHALDHVAFAFPERLARNVPDDVIICRCEGLRAANIRQMARDTEEIDLNRIKAFTRLGMGRCQGRVCVAAATAVLAGAATDMSSTGRYRCQAPVKPVPLRAFLGGCDEQV
ncbi:NAD(P)/FAD-dependent oxidoreductase [Aliirhizobium smilacinae]|uniref:NAD(P)/FAD-dependent oxidoreductase n=2 Tax=Aliirhizobium smilacinae TaxID=1395944 RepID=A0A5C4XTP7_9HYPH|nr:NAD(P)/FAD-dependent oxidoreductase [Rhizobium smilacinae]